MKTIFGAIISALLLSGCMTANQHIDAVNGSSAEKITVGTVQKEIKVGMSAADVVESLGSPNIVSTDEKRREVWIYDKLATNYAHSSSGGGVSALIIDKSIGDGALLSPDIIQGAGAASSSQRTLTIVIKFDEDGKVRDFSYRTSRF